MMQSVFDIERTTQAWRTLHLYLCDMALHGDVHAKRSLNAMCGLATIPLLEPCLTLDAPGTDAQAFANVLFEHYAFTFGTLENATMVARYLFHRKNHNDVHAQETLNQVAQVLLEE